MNSEYDEYWALADALYAWRQKLRARHNLPREARLALVRRHEATEAEFAGWQREQR